MKNELVLQIKEEQLQNWITQLAKLSGWRVYHTYDSRRSTPGFPDLTMVHAGKGRVIFAELKSTKGRVTKAQKEWLADLAATGQEVYIWRPTDWVAGTIRDTLTRQ